MKVITATAVSQHVGEVVSKLMAAKHMVPFGCVPSAFFNPPSFCILDTRQTGNKDTQEQKRKQSAVTVLCQDRQTLSEDPQ